MWVCSVVVFIAILSVFGMTYIRLAYHLAGAH